MRTLNVVFTDREYKKLEKAKQLQNLPWHDFIISMLIIWRKYKNDF